MQLREKRKAALAVLPSPSATAAASAPLAKTAKKAKMAMKKKKASKPTRKTPRRNLQPRTLTCPPPSNEQVWIAGATLQDVQRAHKIGKQPFPLNRTYFITLASPTVRQQVYDLAAYALEDVETGLLPTYGGRRWKVIAHVRDAAAAAAVVGGSNHRKQTSSSSPYFCWPKQQPRQQHGHGHGGQLELAVWPHLLARIPAPPRWPGHQLKTTKTNGGGGSDEDSNDDDDDKVMSHDSDDGCCWAQIRQLQSREITPLSTLAWQQDRNVAPVPTIVMKWISPVRQCFVTRKSAYDHALTLCRNEVLLDRILHGYNARGQPIDPMLSKRASRKQVLQAGKLRFERDGLWVIGQEDAWRKERMGGDVKNNDAVGGTGGGGGGEGLVSCMAAARKRSSPIAYYLHCNRIEYKRKRLSELKTAALAAAAANPVDVFLAKQSLTTSAGDECSNEWSTDVARSASVHDPPVGGELDQSNACVASTTNDMSGPENKTECLSKLHKPAGVSFTLRDSERELRVQWKSLDERERQTWAEGAARWEQGQDLLVVDETNVARSSPFDDDRIGCVTPPSDLDAPRQQEQTTLLVEPTSHHVITPETEQPPEIIAPATKAQVKTCLFGEDGGGVEGGNDLKSSLAPPVAATATQSKERGFSHLWCLSDTQVKLCHDAGVEHYDQILRTVQTRDLSRELKDGFDLLRERGRGRYDMEIPAFDTQQFAFLTDVKKAPWMPIVREILGKDVVLIHKGMFLSMPGAETQDYHQDGPHITTQYQKSCHAVNVFIPVVDLTQRNGPTEFCLGSHILGQEEYDRDYVETPLVSAGTPVIFDYRLGHKGLSNTSTACRPIVYCTYAAAADGKEFRDSANFSRKRYHKIGDLVDKAPSRHERAIKRERTMEEQHLEQAIVESKQLAA